jgi:hypothetical protein
MAKLNPLEINIKALRLIKFNQKERVNLMPQLIELTIYQSMFQGTLMRGDLLLHDPISLFTNWPLVGEDIIEMEYYPSVDPGTEASSTSSLQIESFMVNAVHKIQPDHEVRSQIYVIELFSVEMLTNARLRLQKPYRDSYDKMIKSVLKNELLVDKTKDGRSRIKDENFEQPLGTHHVIVPNMKPLEAISWMTKRAVALDTSEKALYCFWEDFDGFHFRTFEGVQKDIENKAGDIPKYVYLSGMSEAARNLYLRNNKITESHVILAVSIDKRWNTSEKIIAGYYENEYLDIDVFNKKVWSKQDQLDPNIKKRLKEHDLYPLNTPEFIRAMQSQSTLKGSKTRVRYNVSQNQGDEQIDDCNWRDKFGPASRQLTALSQVSIRISLEGDTRVKVGDVIEIELPENHGFTDPQPRLDAYLAGIYVITELKHIIRAGSRHVMTLNINRANYDAAPSKTNEYGRGNTNGE